MAIRPLPPVPSGSSTNRELPRDEAASSRAPAQVKLELQRNGISADGARHIARALEHNTTLQYLGFAFNGFGDQVGQRPSHPHRPAL